MPHVACIPLAPILAFALRLPAAAFAQNEDATPETDPDEVAHLRVVMPVGETVRIEGHNLVPAPDSPASPWAAVGAEPEIIVADVRATLATKAGRHYSCLWGIAGSGRLVEDLLPASGDEAVLRLCNLSSVAGVDLWLDGQDAAAIGGVGPIDAGAVVVEPGSLAVELRSGDAVVGVIEKITVDPGQGISVAVWGDPETLGFGAFPDLYEFTLRAAEHAPAPAVVPALTALRPRGARTKRGMPCPQSRNPSRRPPVPRCPPGAANRRPGISRAPRGRCMTA
jgi:hypothetical protein